MTFKGKEENVLEMFIRNAKDLKQVWEPNSVALLSCDSMMDPMAENFILCHSPLIFTEDNWAHPAPLQTVSLSNTFDQIFNQQVTTKSPHSWRCNVSARTFTSTRKLYRKCHHKSMTEQLYQAPPPSPKHRRTQRAVKSSDIIYVEQLTYLSIALDFSLLNPPLPVRLRRDKTFFEFGSVCFGLDRRGVERSVTCSRITRSLLKWPEVSPETSSSRSSSYSEKYVRHKY